MRSTRLKKCNKVATTTFMLMISLFCLLGCSDPKNEQALSQVKRITKEYDKKTTESGVYIRASEGELKEKDPWGTPLVLSYSQGGVAEMVTVTSAGRDKTFHTADDVEAQGIAVNFKGAGEGIKKNIEETSANAAKGFVKGAVKGVKESIKESLPFKKKKKDVEEKDGEAAEAETKAREDG